MLGGSVFVSVIWCEVDGRYLVVGLHFLHILSKLRVCMNLHYFHIIILLFCEFNTKITEKLQIFSCYTSCLWETRCYGESLIFGNQLYLALVPLIMLWSVAFKFLF